MNDTFPNFTDSDVTISIGRDIYHLHARKLSSKSHILKELVGETALHNSINLELVEAGDRYEYGRLVVQESDTGPCEWPQDIRAIWKNIFSSFYGLTLDLKLEEDSNIIEHCWGLSDVAEQLRIKSFLVFSMDAAFAALGEQLFSFIAADPISWINIARRIRHPGVFKEAVIHVVGNWDQWDEDALNSLQFDVHDMCMDMHHDFQRQKALVDNKLLDFGPETLGLHDHNTHKKTAVAIYRQWLSHEMIRKFRTGNPNGGAAFYRAVAAGGPVQLSWSADDLELYHPMPITATDHQEIKESLMQLSGHIAGLVHELVVNKSMYNPDIYGELPYLTCCAINDDGCPWYLNRDESESSLDLSEFGAENMEEYMVERVDRLISVDVAGDYTQMEE